MKPKTKSELMAEWDSQPGRLKKEREVKAVCKAMDDARAVMQDGLTRYVKKKTKARSMAKAEANPFAELEGWESMEQIQDAYGYGEITADRRDKLTDLWEAREAAQKQEEQQRGRKTLHVYPSIGTRNRSWSHTLAERIHRCLWLWLNVQESTSKWSTAIPQQMRRRRSISSVSSLRQWKNGESNAPSLCHDTRTSPCPCGH